MTARWGGSCCWPLWNWQESTDPLWVILSGGGLAGWKGTQEIGDNPGRGWLAAGQTLMDSGGFFPYNLGLKLWHLGLGQRTLLYTLCYYAKDDTETDADSYETQGITWLPLVSISPQTLILWLVALCKAVWRFSESCHAVLCNWCLSLWLCNSLPLSLCCLAQTKRLLLGHGNNCWNSSALLGESRIEVIRGWCIHLATCPFISHFTLSLHGTGPKQAHFPGCNDFPECRSMSTSLIHY